MSYMETCTACYEVKMYSYEPYNLFYFHFIKITNHLIILL